jgi:hypothetical protein
MAYDTVAKTTVDEIFEGLQGTPSAVADRACKRVTVDSRVGSYAAHASYGNLSQLSDDGLAEGVEAREKVHNVTNTDFSLKRFVGIGSIHDGDKLSLQKGNFSPLTRMAESCRREAGAKLDSQLNTVLTDTDLNLTQAVGNGAWSSSSSTPYADITAALKKCGYGDLMVLGREQMEELMEHPDFTGKFLGFAGGAIAPGELQGVLRSLFPSVRTIVLGDTVYNSANVADTVSLAYTFDGTAWVGHSEDLVLLELPGFESEMARNIFAEKDIVRYTRRAQVIRPHKEMGCTLTGV